MESRVVKNWLSRKPADGAGTVAWFSTLLLVLGGLMFWQNWLSGSEWMSASRTLVFHDKEIWRAWSTLFVHGDGKHLLANTFLFFILGFFLNGYFGFLLFPIVAFFIGGVTNLIVLAGMPSETHLVGASGIVFWMGGAWLVLYTLLESRKSLFQRTLRALGVGALMFMPAEAFDPHVSYQAHLVGFILGVVCGLIFYQMRRSEFLAAEIREMIVDEADVIPDGVPPQ